MTRSKSISFALLAVLLVLAGLAIWIVTRPIRIYRSQRSEALQEMAMLARALELWVVPDIGHYPSAQEFAKGVDYNYWAPQVTTDPWGNPYQYRPLDRQGSSYELFSFGADGAPGGDGSGADIVAPPPY